MASKKAATIARELVDEHWPRDVPVEAILKAAGPDRREEIAQAVAGEAFRRDLALIERCEALWTSGSESARRLGVLRRSWVNWKGNRSPLPEYIRRSIDAHLRLSRYESV